MNLWEKNIIGVVSIVVGLYLLACSFGLFPLARKNKESNKKKEPRKVRIERIIGILLIIGGVWDILR